MENHKMTKFNVKDKFIRTSSVACASDPQGGALAAIQNKDLLSFTDILNTKEIEDNVDDPSLWIYSPIKEEKNYSLVELAVEEDNQGFADVLSSIGARIDFLNVSTGYAPLHRLAIEGNADVLATFLKKSGPKLEVNTRAGRIKRGYTALHFAVEKTTDKHGAFLDLLLGREDIDVDALDSSGTVTPLYLAGKQKNEPAVRKLIEYGARIDMKVGKTGKTVGDFLEKFVPGINYRNIRVLRQRKKEDNIKDKLLDILKNTYLDSPDYFHQYIKFREACLSLTEASTGFQDLVEKCCRKGLGEFALVLFNKNADPNKFGQGSLSCPVIDAAERVDYRLLQVLRRAGADFAAEKLRTQETVLHVLFKNYQKNKEENFMKCLDGLLTYNDDKLRTSIDGILNRRDINGNTALHYATEKCSEGIIRRMLQRGANIGIKNVWGEIPISRICPKLLENFLDEDCLEGNGEIYEKDFRLTFKYSFLAPDPQSLPESYRPKLELEECTPLQPTNTDQERKDALPETESLWYMGQSREHRHLLKHPVITSFLWFKWERMRPYFNRNLRLYLLFVFISTWYIFNNFGGFQQKQNIRDSFYGMYIALFVFTLGLMVKDWVRGLRGLRMMPDDTGMYSTVHEQDTHKMLISKMSSNLLDFIQLGGMIGLFFIQPQHLYIPLIVLLSILFVREVLQLMVSMKRYILSLENWIEVIMIVLLTVIIATEDNENFMINRHLGAIALVLSWSELITMVGRHPKLLHFNIYVTMFYKVLNSFFLFLLWYSMFIVAFGLGFYIMLHTDTETDVSGLEENEQNPLFNRTWLSLVKTSAMFVGELEFSDLPINSSTYLGMVAYGYFLSFVFLIVVVLMNLLNGLAVSDTSDIKAKAEIYSYISRVETISYMESTLLGDPFDFLSNVPSFLKNIPSMSFFRQCYRSESLRQVFTKLGAKELLIFYNVLKDKEYSFQPNRRSNLCSLTADQLGLEIILSAKDILTRRRNAGEDEETEVNQLKARIKELENMHAKLDLLIKRK